jgi:PIN domain nuclease of toxin-antitoxin system
VLLLDTHVWLWSAEGDVRRVGRRARQLLARAEAREAIRVSPVAIFELTALHTLGRVRLARSLEQWVRDSLDDAGVRVAELTPVIALDAGSIPRAALADPLDRLLVATARHLDAVFLTADARILEYGAKTGAVRVQDART